MASAGPPARRRAPPLPSFCNGKPPACPSAEPSARWVSKEQAAKRPPARGADEQRVAWDWHAGQWVVGGALPRASPDPLSEADANRWTAAHIEKSAKLLPRHPLQRAGRPGGWVSEADGRLAEDASAGSRPRRTPPALRGARRKGFYVADLQGRRRPLQRELLLLRKEKNIKKSSLLISRESNSSLIDKVQYEPYLCSPRRTFSDRRVGLVSDTRYGDAHAKKQAELRCKAYASVIEAEHDDDSDDTESFHSERSACGMSWHWPGSQRVKQDVQTDSGSGCLRVPKRATRRNRLGHKFSSERSMSSFDSDSESAPLMTDPEPIHEFSEGLTASSVEPSSKAHAAGFQLKEKEGKSRKQGIATARKHRSLSTKYRPKLMKDLMGQAMVMESLSNAIMRDKIAPVYLFHGPRGTGKTTAAKIFTAAINCLSIEELRPCTLCAECTSLYACQSHDLKEIDAAGNNDVESMRLLLSNVSQPPTKSRYKVYIVDDCHTLSSEAWSALLKSLEEPPSFVVFILITTDLELIPRTAISRCQKFMFVRIKETDIVHRLRKLALLEKIDIDMEALQFIASKADGSFREAENVLDQLSLLGNKITLATVEEMAGLIPDGKLAMLLEWALSADTVNTVNTIRDLMETGVEPLALTSQLAMLITDILAGKKRVIGAITTKVREEEHVRLKQALKILLDAEKQLRSCTDRTTWLTAAFLQFASHEPCLLPSSSRGTSVAPSPMTLFNAGEKVTVDPKSWGIEERWDPCMGLHSAVVPSSPGYLAKAEVVSRRQHNLQIDHQSGLFFGDCDASAPPSGRLRQRIRKESSTASPCTIDTIWKKVIQGSRSNILKQLLQEQSRLVSIAVTEAYSIAHLEFRQPEHKAMAERARTNITSLFELALGCSVKVEFHLAKSSDEGCVVSRTKTPFVQRNAETPKLHRKDPLCEDIQCKVYSFKESFNSSRNVTSAAASPLRRNNEHRRPRHGFEADRNTVVRGVTDSFSKDREFYERRRSKEGAAWAVKPHSLYLADTMREEGQKEVVGGAQGRNGQVRSQDVKSNVCTSMDEGAHLPSQMPETDHHSVEYSSDSDGSIDREDPGALCWKGSRRTSEKKEKRNMRLRRRRGRLLLRLVPCAKGSGRKRGQMENSHQ